MIALSNVALSGHKKFFLGSDSAPHLIEDKQSDCGCAGVYSAKYLIEILVQFFDVNNSLSNFENFVSKNGAIFYGVPFNKKKLLLERGKIKIPNFIGNEDMKIIPMMAGESVNWTSKLVE
jgi:dihydroorotase